jgi:hypothetical protein
MRIGFRKTNEEIKAQALQLKNELKQACEEFNRSDLYEALSWTLNLEPRGRDLNHLLTAGTSVQYCIAGNVMLYESKNDQAKRYFEKALELPWSNSGRRTHLTLVIGNFDVASKIARRYWELTGKGRPVEKPEQATLTHA